MAPRLDNKSSRWTIYHGEEGAPSIIMIQLTFWMIVILDHQPSVSYHHHVPPIAIPCFSGSPNSPWTRKQSLRIGGIVVAVRGSKAPSQFTKGSWTIPSMLSSHAKLTELSLQGDRCRPLSTVAFDHLGSWRDEALPAVELGWKGPDQRCIGRFLRPLRFKWWYSSTPGPAQSLVPEPDVDRSCEVCARTAMRALPMNASACPRASVNLARCICGLWMNPV